MVTEADPIWSFFKITSELQRAYNTVFDVSKPGVAVVLVDLARMCCAYSPAETEREIGMRDVWLHIQKRRMLRDEELVAIMAKLKPQERAALFDRKSPMYSPR